MSYCLNPVCQKPQNPDTLECCRNCGAKLLLKDRYRPVKPIAQGGFGRTFLAIDEDKPSKPRCVVKQFFPAAQGVRQIKKAADLFDQEALRLEELGNHPQIPALLAHFNQDGQQYLVQEFIHGKTLAELLQERGSFNEVEVWEVLTSLLPVLEFIHSHGVIHRDIKPGNIILTPGKRSTGSGSQAHSDWGALLQALSLETADGFRDLKGNRQRFSEFLSQSLANPPRELAIADYGRWQQMASQFAAYSEMSLSQRQFLVADTSRLLYEMRRKYGQPDPLRGEMVLVDFGAAKAAVGTALVKTGTTIGSPEYLAPEQARGKAVFASDLYSLGVVCIHLLTGRSPFDLFDADHNLWVWRRYLIAPVSDALGKVLDRMLEAGLRQRYSSAEEVLVDLQRHRQSSASPPPSNGLPPVLNLQRRRQPPFSAHPSSPSSPPPPSPHPTPPTPPPKSTPAKRRSPQPSPTWQAVHQLSNPSRIYAIALHPTVPLLATTSGTTIRLWDIEIGQPVRTLTGHLDIIDCFAISADGRLLISGSADKSIRLWDMVGGQRLGSLNLHSDTVLSIALHPDGNCLASGSLYDPVKLWDLRHQREWGDLEGHTGRVESLAFSPDGKYLVAGSNDAVITIWDVTTGQGVRSLKGHTQAIPTLSFSPDGKTLVSASVDGTVKLWSTQTWREKRTLTPNCGRISTLIFHPDGKLLAIGGDSLQFWSPRTGKEALVLPEQKNLSALAIHPSGKTMVSASRDGEIRVWEYRS
jgi:WD40 repeat protein